MLGTKIVLNKKNAKDDCRILKIPSFIDRPQTKKIRSIRVTILPLFFIFCSVSVVSAQSVGINTLSPDASAALDITSTTQGFLPPRLTKIERNAIAAPATGLVVWCTNCGVAGELQFFNGTAWKKSGVLPGTAQGQMQYWNGTEWVVIAPGTEGQTLTYVNGIPTWTTN
jgi:hypothetical protein